MEYDTKMAMIVTSDASVEVKEKALVRLKEMYGKRDNKELLRDIIASQADGIDYD